MDGRTVRLSLRWSLTQTNERTDGRTKRRTASAHGNNVHRDRRRVDVAATRRPCQDTNGRTNGQTPGIELGAFQP